MTEPSAKFIFLGGDHSITLPIIKVLHDFYDDLFVIHFDAHLDRRESFFGNRFSHATVIKRVEELIGEERVLTFGYRSKAPEEPAKGFPFKVFDNLKENLNSLGSHVYLTIDLDILDPSEFPAVSNPEPGGISFKELQESINLLKGRLIGVDIVEFNPLSAPLVFPAVTAALLLREIIIQMAS